MYMSYCRFEGTLAELRACLSEVEDHIYEEAEYDVSEGEIRQFRRMIETITDFMGEHEIIDCDGQLDEERLDEICEKMRHGNVNEEG